MLKGAIIGTGKVAMECHLPAFESDGLKNRAKIIAAADVNRTSLKNAEKLYSYIRYYKSLDELLNNENLDFIDICTPPAYHYQALLEAIRSNLCIICEKPFTSVFNEAEKIYLLLQNSPLPFLPCHQYRYFKVWQQFKEYILEMQASDSAFLQFNVFRTEADNGLKVLNNKWRINPEISGGGILSDTGVHYLYLCLWMFGTPLSVTARTFNLQHKNFNIEDTVTIILEFKNAVAEINLTWAADKRANDARLVTRRGSLIYDGKTLSKYLNNSAEKLIVPDASDKTNYIAMYVSLFDDFFNSVGCKKQGQEMLFEALQTVKLLGLCYKSARDGKTLEYDLE